MELVDINLLSCVVERVPQKNKAAGSRRAVFRLLINGVQRTVDPPSSSLRASFNFFSNGASALSPNAKTGCQKK